MANPLKKIHEPRKPCLRDRKEENNKRKHNSVSPAAGSHEGGFGFLVDVTTSTRKNHRLP